LPGIGAPLTDRTFEARRLWSLLYLAALVILLDQVSDLIGTVWPLRFELARWRVGVFGLGIAKLEFVALADAMILAAAVLLQQRKVIYALGVVHFLIGIALLGGLALFSLDTFQIRPLMQLGRTRELDIAAARTVVLTGVTVIACFLVTRAAWRSRGTPQHLERSPEDYLMIRPAGKPAE